MSVALKTFRTDSAAFHRNNEIRGSAQISLRFGTAFSAAYCCRSKNRLPHPHDRLIVFSLAAT